MICLERWVKERDRVLVMGVLNVTPDSFFADSRVLSPRLAVERARRMVDDGADIIDVGGESSRPGSQSTSEAEELERVLPVIEKLHAECDAVLSVDTTKAAVAREALDHGATIVNDITALTSDSDMAPLIAARRAYVVLMHMQGTPRMMQEAPQYTDVVDEVRRYLVAQADNAVRAGVSRDRVFLDPGIGFGKRLEHNLALLRHIDCLVAEGFPVAVGVSRKSFLGEILALPAAERLEGTLAAESVAVARGVDVLRVHDVKEGRRAADVARFLRA